MTDVDPLAPAVVEQNISEELEFSPEEIELFWSKAEIAEWDSCWIWRGAYSGASSRSGRYGAFTTRGRKRLAHRVAYELLVGPIPRGLVIDHVRAWGCENTLCVNPLHLEAVTNRENVLRGVGYSALNARKTHCPRGHPLVPRGDCRVCLPCQAAACRRWKAKQRVRR